ncbi:MAG: PQQ-like beta-propeller repeat protein [Gemmatimonadota bacterium]|nr:PQQ-like beta-propeller repeat protein [Gemmatimonadota bacterium]
MAYADDEVAIFATGGDTRVMALDAQSGKKRWETRLALPSEYRGRGFPPGRLVGSGEIVAIPAWDLYGLDKKTGQVRWTLAPEDDFPGAGVMLGEDGDLYATGFHLYRVDAATGRVLWKTPIPAPEEPANGGLVGAGALTPELYVVASVNGRIYALDRKTGQVRWEAKGSGPFDVGVVIIGDLAVTATGGGLESYVEGFDLATGRQRWKVGVGSSSVFGSLARSGRFVLVSNGRVQAISAEGRVVWGYGGAGWNQPIISSSAQVHGERVYLGTYEGFAALRAPQ